MSRGQVRHRDDRLVAVCDVCRTASCSQGLFMCDSSRTAGTVNYTVRELRQLGLEHPSYWGENL
jgi:hypothetical protein